MFLQNVGTKTHVSLPRAQEICATAFWIVITRSKLEIKDATASILFLYSISLKDFIFIINLFSTWVISELHSVNCKL